MTSPRDPTLWKLSALIIDLNQCVLISRPRAKWGKIFWFVRRQKKNILEAPLSRWSNLVSFHRARLVNYIKTSEVIRQSYPLQIRASGPHSYFMKRETWGWTDFLMNPMVKKVDDVALNLHDTVRSGVQQVRCLYSEVIGHKLICLCCSCRLWWWFCPCWLLFYCPRWSTPMTQRWERWAILISGKCHVRNAVCTLSSSCSFSELYWYILI